MEDMEAENVERLSKKSKTDTVAKPWRLTRAEIRRRLPYWFAIIFILGMLLGFVVGVGWAAIQFNYSVTMIFEYVKLDQQRFCDYCDGCYCFNGTSISTRSNVLNRYSSEVVEIWFADEFEMRDEWKKGDTLLLSWIRTSAGWRVRGVVKV